MINKEKNKNKAKQTEKTDPKKKKMMIAAAVGLGVFLMLLIAFAVIYPLSSINSEFDRLVSKAEGMRAPTVVITDMLADNVFSDSSGEVTVTEIDQTCKLINELCGVAREMKYSGKNTDSFSAWDIRLIISEEGERVVLYLAEGRIYYAVGSVEYYFVPQNAEIGEAYSQLYEEVCRLLKKTEGVE